MILGVGAGGAPDEFFGAGIPGPRGARTDEYLEAMIELDTTIKQRGRFVDFEIVRSPKPASLRIRHLVGGRSDAALRRALIWEAGTPALTVDALRGRMAGWRNSLPT